MAEGVDPLGAASFRMPAMSRCPCGGKAEKGERRAGKDGKSQSRRTARRLLLDGKLAQMRRVLRHRTGRGGVEVAAGFASASSAAARGGRKAAMDIFLLILYGWKDTAAVYEQVEFFLSWMKEI